MAKDCDKTIKSFEVSSNIKDMKIADKYPYTNRGESETQATIRCTSKLFHDPQYNCAKTLRLHLKNTGSVTAETENRSVVFHHFVGNHFHIYFLNRAGCAAYNNSSTWGHWQSGDWALHAVGCKRFAHP